MPSLTAAVRATVLAGILAFAAAILGLASWHAFSVAFWPANAVIAGLMVRDQRLRRASAWIGVAAGYIAADLSFGRPLPLATFFATANLVSAASATFLLIKLDARDLQLRRMHSVLRILACLVPASLAGGLIGAVLVIVEFAGSPWQTMMTWPASELANYLVVLPVLLTAPPLRLALRPVAELRRVSLASIWPALALAASSVAAALFDGPGCIMFPVPALLLCVLRCSVPVTTLLTMVLGVGALVTIGLGIVDIGQDMTIPRHVVSVRIAIAFLVLVPLTICSAMAVHDDLLKRVREAADHDALTGLLNRRAFEERIRERLRSEDTVAEGLAILWLDIDHFKSINDRHGHLAGDMMLQTFATVAKQCCRENDLIGRLGGEEFALSLTVANAELAQKVAERLRVAFAARTFHWNAEPVRATVSIAGCFLEQRPPSMSDLLRELDEALYRAKHKGRNRVEWLEQQLSR
jgi:diguanylate cyclase (GGDEF)-like protein